MLLTPAQIKPPAIVWIETELFFSPGVNAPHVYVRAWAVGCFHSLNSTRTFRRALTASVDSCAEMLGVCCWCSPWPVLDIGPKWAGQNQLLTGTTTLVNEPAHDGGSILQEPSRVLLHQRPRGAFLCIGGLGWPGCGRRAKDWILLL